MKCLLLLMFFFTASLLSGNFYAQISGIINQYTPVTQVSCNQLDVEDASFLSAGDRVLIIQMKGAEIDVSNSVNFGNISNYHNCGNYEFAKITAISGNTVTLQYQLLNGYDVSGYVQLIRVPQYSNVTVTGSLFPQPWNGSTGGVLVMEVSGTLTLDAAISAAGCGFRGSFSSFNPDGGCGNFPDYYYPVASGHGALKGEGIVEVSTAMNGGRGALANGGGGGNKHNSGGGGGSNGSKGGRGGDQAGFCGQQPIGGEGGKALNYGLGRLFMGGGGGSPDYNDGVGNSGSNGGGIVIIRAATIVTNNNMYIESTGTNVVSAPNSIGDGAGGGGAGGAIALEVNSFVGNLILRVDGGDGGDQMTTYPSCFGTGGGGGTGAIQYSGSGIPPNVTTTFIPGDVGTDLTGNPSCTSSYGAASGYFSPVYVLNKLLPESSTLPSGTIDIGPDIATCDFSATINPAINATSYLWSTGETTPSITVTASGEYWLSVNSGTNNCWLTDTILVDLSSLAVNAGPDQAICIGQNVTLNATSPGNNVTFSWDNGVVNNTPFSPQTTMSYTVTATDAIAGCSATDEVLVTVNPLPVVTVSSSTALGCAPLSVTFTNASTDCENATWTFSNGIVLNGCGNQQVMFENPGCYDLSVDVTSNAGCSGSADFQSIVCVHPDPIAAFQPSPVILNPENLSTTLMNQSQGGVHYEWNFGDGTASDLFSPAHAYSSEEFRSFAVSLLVTNQFGCTDIAYGTVYMEGGVIYYVPNTFTPDGNEMNPVFTPVFSSGIDSSDFKLQIFNRWGEVIFESKDLQIGWDGTYNGIPSPEGIYTWRIEFKHSKNDEKEIIHGHLNLMK